MCGILGTLKFNSLDSLVQLPSSAFKALEARGPDGQGAWEGRGIAMGMRRLAINGLKNGQQPFFNEDRSVVAVANGEIYNYVELRTELQKRGHQFQGDSDCEVMVHLYEEKGEKFVSEMAGMFACAIWDQKKRKLVLARDRMGEKPLYLFRRGGELSFASEIRALCRLTKAGYSLDASALAEFLLFEYVHDPKTPIEGITKLAPGTCLTVEGDSGRETVHAYWDFPSSCPIGIKPEEDVRGSLEIASREILRSERPIAVALSGGLDSGLVLALAAKSAGQTGGLRSITVGYPGKPEMDEREPAKRLAEELGVEHHEVEISTQAVVDNFSALVDACDDLLADIAGQGYFALSQKSSEMGAPVLLMGQGGDELFWGYSWVRETAQRMSEATHGRTGGWIEMLLGRGNSFYANSPEIHRARRTLPLFSKMPSFGNIYRSSGKEWDRQADPAGLRITRMISRTYLLANGLPLADRLGMAHSVEARQLLLDHRLWDKVLAHRAATPDQFLPPKTWLKNVAREILPEWWLDRPKRGFAPPGKEWKRAILQKHGALLWGGAWAESGLLPERWIRRVMTLGQTKARYTDMAYKLLVGECWMRNIRKYCA